MNKFRYCIYLFISPLLLYTSIQQNSIPLFLCFLIIVMSHLYKDCQDKKYYNKISWSIQGVPY